MTTPSSVTTAPDETDFAGAVAAAVADVDGVHALGRSLERASNALRERVGLTSLAPGVKVERDRGGPARVAVSVVVDYPHKLQEVADAVRKTARDALVTVGLKHAEVAVRVTDVWGPFDREAPAHADGVPTGDASAAVAASDVSTTQDTVRDDATTRPAGGGNVRSGDADEVVAEALTEVAEAVARAADDVRSDRRAD